MINEQNSVSESISDHSVASVVTYDGRVDYIMEDGVGEHYVAEICHLFQANGERVLTISGGV